MEFPLARIMKASAAGKLSRREAMGTRSMGVVALVVDAILDCSRRKGIVLDAFAGSGTTLVAAHKTGRRGYGIELDPLYCDIIVRRLAKAAKLEAVLVETGQAFAAVADERAAAPAAEAQASAVNGASVGEAAE